MKKIILFFTAILLLNTIASAQVIINITGDDLPQAGSTYITVTDTNPTVLLGTTGPQSWNFSSLDSNYTRVANYELTSETPYAGIFTESNIYTYGPALLFPSFSGGTPVFYNGYMFWQSDNTGFKIIGWRADEGPDADKNIFQTPPELIIGAPNSQDSIFYNETRWEVPRNDNPLDNDTFYVCNIFKTHTSDAWGSLIIPYDTFNVIRIHEYVIRIDSIIAKLGGSTTVIFEEEIMRDTSNNYIFMTEGVGYPVAIVHADVNNVIKDVEYLIDTLTTAVNEMPQFNHNKSAVAFPNPFNNYTTISVHNAEKSKISFCLFDQYGKKIKQIKKVRNNNIKIYRENLPQGVYFYKIYSNKKTISSGKLIIVD